MKLNTKLLIGLFFFFSSIGIHANLNMRRCMLLPVQDYVDGAVAYKVYEDVENYLKNSEWCFYKSNSEILNILQNFKKNLKQHLKNKDVLKVISEKTKTGSLIRIEIDHALKGVKIMVEVVGANGEDVYFKEETRLDTDDVLVISQTVKNWLDVYEKQIPYDGQVIGVLGNQFTVDVGKHYGVLAQDEVIIKRPTKKQKHPLLKEIVDWDTMKIASGKIVHSANKQSQGKVIQYDTKRKVHIGDWVNVVKSDKNKNVVRKKFTEPDEYEFGKLGYVQILFGVGSGSATSNTDGATTKKVGGINFGVDFKTELWATRNFFGSIELGRRFGSYSKKEGTLVNDSNSLSESSFALKMGYKYLPLGFFYGPQIDGYIGYANYTYGFDTSSADGFTEFSFKGILIGTKGSMPLIKDLRAFIELNFMFNPNYAEEVTIYGQDDSASHFHIAAGTSYTYSPSLTFDGEFGITNSEAEFLGPVREVKVKNTALKFGASYSF